MNERTLFDNDENAWLSGRIAQLRSMEEAQTEAFLDDPSESDLSVSIVHLQMHIADLVRIQNYLYSHTQTLQTP
ncbi:hypothetical protein GCM10028807_62780 [Spirosoma daeguense]